MSGTLFRVLLVMAAVSFAGSLIVGSLPTRVRPAVLVAPAGSETVDCGSVFSGTEWTNDDACDGARINRAGLMVLGFLIAIAFFLGSVVVLVVTVRRGGRSPIGGGS